MKKSTTEQQALSRFAKKIARLRQSRGLTLTQLCKALDISPSHISRLESGERLPSKTVVLKMAQVFFPDDDGTARDDLLMAAGFTPMNTQHLIHLERKNRHQSLEESLADNSQNFRLYDAFVISLIRNGQLNEAQQAIQKGLELFDDSVELQILLARLELLRGHYQESVIAQQSALTYYHLQDEAQKHPAKLAALVFNLGVTFYVQGDAYLNHSMELEEAQQHQEAELEKHLACDCFTKAKTHFQEALTHTPDDIFMLDELARVHFSLALTENNPASPAWNETIIAFNRVLASEKAAELSYDTFIEVGIFLAHAYTKHLQFFEAETVLNVMQTYGSGHWLICYTKACLYSLRYEHEPNEEWLKLALRHLQKALAFADTHNRTRQDAGHDPDLKALRQGLPEAFTAIIHKGDLESL